MKPRYYVFTWDSDREAFTPQQGVRCGPWSLFGLRRALRRLRAMDYSACRGDPSVLVERADHQRWPQDYHQRGNILFHDPR